MITALQVAVVLTCQVLHHLQMTIPTQDQSKLNLSGQVKGMHEIHLVLMCAKRTVQGH